VAADPIAGMRTIFFLLGGGIGTVGLVLFVRRLGQVIGWKRAHGEVVAMRLGASTHSGAREKAVRVRFHGDDGEEIVAEDSFVTVNFVEGQEVTVYWRPGDPPDVIVPDFMRMWFLAVVLLALGSMFVVTAIVA